MRNKHCRKLSRPQTFPVARTVGLLGLLSAYPILVPTLVPAHAAPTEIGLLNATPELGSSDITRLTVGKSKLLTIDPRARISFITGDDLVYLERTGNRVTLFPQATGRVVMETSVPGVGVKTYIFPIIASAGYTAVSQMRPTPASVLAPQMVASTLTAAAAAEAAPAVAPATEPVLPPAAPLPSGMAMPPTTEPNIGPDTRVSQPVLPEPMSRPSRVPTKVSPPPAATRAKSQAIPIRQGLARLLSTKSKMLAVFFSDENIMDARAINAQTLAVTGKNPGTATMAIFTSRWPNDVIGQVNVYNVEILPKLAAPIPVPVITDPSAAEAAIRAALDDRRIGVSVIRTPSGSLFATLTGTVQAAEEVDAAKRITAFFVPEVVSSLVVDAKSPKLGAEAMTTEEAMQVKLRSLTNNDTIQVVPMPGSLIVKAEVNSPAEADMLMRLLPSLNQKVTPLIVIRGGAAQEVYTPSRPILNEEEERITQTLQGVTGLRNVYVVRSAQNALAVYGTVADRKEAERLRRYAYVLPQILAGQNASGPAVGAALPNNRLPAMGPYAENKLTPLVQLFVRVLDPEAANVRLVNVETNVVEIARTGMRNLGVEFGTATLLSETADATGTTRTIDPTIRQGVIVAGNGFTGTGGFNTFDPFRARLNALYQNGSAKILSQPNVSVLEGLTGQIVVGGQRPIPMTSTNGGGAGAVQETIEFRRFGIILTMRPTVGDNDTIFLQIRGSVTELDYTTAITRNNSQIPGEKVRSVDTTLTVRAGDTVVMGGLIANDRRVDVSKVPWLSKIPVLGALFQSKKFQNNETELAIFLTPRIQRMPLSSEEWEWVRGFSSMDPLPSNDEANQILTQNTMGGN